MILFVFEGNKREPELFRAIETLFFKDSQHIVCSFGNNIYELYQQLKDLDGSGDMVSLLRERYDGRPDSPFSEESKSSDFSEIYLIFDYDFHNRNISLNEMNSRISEMLDMFGNETENGKLYINYPMVESFFHMASIPDPNYDNYDASIEELKSHKYKKRVQQETVYHEYRKFASSRSECSIVIKQNISIINVKNIRIVKTGCSEYLDYVFFFNIILFNIY